MGVVSGCCCKEVYRYPHIFPYSTCISSFLAAASLRTSFLKCFFVLVYVIFVRYTCSTRCSKNIRDRSREYN